MSHPLRFAAPRYDAYCKIWVKKMENHLTCENIINLPTLNGKEVQCIVFMKTLYGEGSIKRVPMALKLP
jgi:hypothetical protein